MDPERSISRIAERCIKKQILSVNACQGSGSCESTCPKLFKAVDGISRVQVDTVPEEEEDCAKKAVNGRPVGAISIT